MGRVLACFSVVMVLGFTVPEGAIAATGSLAERCPPYVAALQRAKASLLGGDQTAAIAALRGARTALAECIRRDAGEAGGRVMLAASSVVDGRYGLRD